MPNFFSVNPNLPLPERTRRRVTWHLIPYLFFLYVLAYLDRVNVSVAALELKKPIEEGGMGFTQTIIGFGAGVFFWGYWILEIPSTVSVLKWGARFVFVRILVLWGLCCTLIGFINMPFASALFSWIPTIPQDTGLVLSLDWFIDALFGWLVRTSVYHGPVPEDMNIVLGPVFDWMVLLSNPDMQVIWFGTLVNFINGLPDDPVNQFYFFRFMLGFFEGGFFPSVIVYLSLWFRAQDRAKAIATFMSAIPLSSALGSPLSGLLLNINWFDMPGWRWIFIIQGVVPVFAGFATMFFLPDRPHKAPWLPKDERDWLLAELDKEQAGKQNPGHWAWLHHAGLVLLLTGAYFCLNITNYGLGMFMPAILQSQSGSSNLLASVLTFCPYMVAFVVMLVNGWHSDRTRERIWHVAVPLFGLSLGIYLAGMTEGVVLVPILMMIVIVGACMYAHLPAYWPIPTMFLGSLAAASATGFINMIGNLGGFVGPAMVGKSAQEHESFGPALFMLAPMPLIAAVIILLVGYTRRKQLAPDPKATTP